MTQFWPPRLFIVICHDSSVPFFKFLVHMDILFLIICPFFFNISNRSKTRPTLNIRSIKILTAWLMWNCCVCTILKIVFQQTLSHQFSRSANGDISNLKCELCFFFCMFLNPNFFFRNVRKKISEKWNDQCWSGKKWAKSVQLSEFHFF